MSQMFVIEISSDDEPSNDGNDALKNLHQAALNAESSARQLERQVDASSKVLRRSKSRSEQSHRNLSREPSAGAQRDRNHSTQKIERIQRDRDQPIRSPDSSNRVSRSSKFYFEEITASRADPDPYVSPYAQRLTKSGNDLAGSSNKPGVGSGRTSNLIDSLSGGSFSSWVEHHDRPVGLKALPHTSTSNRPPASEGSDAKAENVSERSTEAPPRDAYKPCREAHRKCNGRHADTWPCQNCVQRGLQCSRKNDTTLMKSEPHASGQDYVFRSPAVLEPTILNRRPNGTRQEQSKINNGRTTQLSKAKDQDSPRKRGRPRKYPRPEDEGDLGKLQTPSKALRKAPKRPEDKMVKPPPSRADRHKSLKKTFEDEFEASDTSGSFHTRAPGPRSRASTRQVRHGISDPMPVLSSAYSSAAHQIIHHPARGGPKGVSKLLRLRELGGSGVINNQTIGRNLHDSVCEVTFERWRRFEGASKDIIIAEWSPNGRNFAVSTSTELDSNSRPYNKEKNFLWGDVERDVIRELDAHHVRKHQSETLGDRANSQADRQANSIVDDRLFTTVSSVCFNSSGRRMVSGSYDNTVKIWSTSNKRRAPKCLQTFQHDSRVEILSFAQVGESGVLATAQHAAERAISLYDVTESHDRGLPDRPFHQLSHGRDVKNALFPSALRWGVHESVVGLLVAGFAEHQQDTEEQDRLGALRIWDVERGVPFIDQLQPSSQCVFDVEWHPRLAVFGAATTSKQQESKRGWTKSVVKTYHPLEGPRRFVEFDCPALDINEIKFHPTDNWYVSASCTDGKVYVWDWRRPDELLRVLEHGPSIEPLDQQQASEETDTGVRLMAWSRSGTKLYTGSSDGVIKCWNPFVSEEDKHIGDVASFDSAVMSGSFSPDFSHLLVGLCKGAVHVLASAPWSACQNNSLESPDNERDLHTNQVQLFREMTFIAATRHGAAEKRALDSGQASERLDSSHCNESFRRHTKKLKATAHSHKREKLRDGHHVSPSTQEDLEPCFEHGISERELSELYDSGDDKAAHLMPQNSKAVIAKPRKGSPVGRASGMKRKKAAKKTAPITGIKHSGKPDVTRLRSEDPLRPKTSTSQRSDSSLSIRSTPESSRKAVSKAPRRAHITLANGQPIKQEGTSTAPSSVRQQISTTEPLILAAEKRTKDQKKVARADLDRTIIVLDDNDS